MAKRRTKNLGDVIRAKLANDPKLAEAVDQERFHADIAQQVYDLRMEAGLSQAQLAQMVGTQQSSISRIEDADYDGHSLTMLRRIAKALHRQLKVDFCAKPVYVDTCTTDFKPEWPTLESWRLIADLGATETLPITSRPFTIQASPGVSETISNNIAGAIQMATAISGPFDVLLPRIALTEALEFTKKI